MNDPTRRALQLLSLLQTHQFWPGGELARRLEVSARTLRRDVDRLRELGYPVDAAPGVAGGYRLGAGAHMPPLLLDDDEAVAIAVGLRAAAGASIDGIEDTSLRALAKLEQVLPHRLRRRVNAVHSNVVALQWAGTGPTVDSEALALLAQACRDHEEVRFDYQRRDGDETLRLVQPHQLVSAGRRWYLVAWDVRRDDWRTFRVDRLHEPQLAGARFAARELPATDAAAFVADSLHAMPLTHEAVMVVNAPVDEVRSILRWGDVEIGTVNDRSCRVRLRADSIEWLTTAVAMVALRFEVEVESPPELTGRLVELRARLGRGLGVAPPNSAGKAVGGV